MIYLDIIVKSKNNYALRTTILMELICPERLPNGLTFSNFIGTQTYNMKMSQFPDRKVS